VQVQHDMGTLKRALIATAIAMMCDSFSLALMAEPPTAACPVEPLPGSLFVGPAIRGRSGIAADMLGPPIPKMVIGAQGNDRHASLLS
jgi:hypothetical protein